MGLFLLWRLLVDQQDTDCETNLFQMNSGFIISNDLPELFILLLLLYMP